MIHTNPRRADAGLSLTRLAGAIFVALVLAACQSVPMTTPVIFDNAPIDQSAVRKTKPVKKVMPVAEIKPAPQPAPVVLLVTSENPAYRSVAEAFIRTWPEPVDTIWLNKVANTDQTIQDLIAKQPSEVIAIGAPAVMSLESTDLRVIQAQSFQQNSLVRSVDAMPEPKAQLQAWVKRAPQIQRIGIIAGAAFAPAMQALAVAGHTLDLEMSTRLVSSDKEALFEFRRLVPDLDGFIFLPDDSVLSPTVIQEIIGHGRTNNIVFLTYNQLMQKLGAQFLVTQDAEDVAKGLVQLVKAKDRPNQALSRFYLHDLHGSHRIDIDG